MNSGRGMWRHRRAVDPVFISTLSGSDSVATGTGTGTDSGTLTSTTGTRTLSTSSYTTTSLTTTSTTSSSSSSSSSVSSTSSSTSSTTSSSSSSSSLTSTSTTITTTSTPLLPTTHTTTPLVNTLTRSVPSVSNTLTSTSAVSSSSSSSTPSSTISTGALVGGIAAGILGVAGVAFAIIYFIRRSGRDKDESQFDSDVFKRQSAMLQDDEPRSSSRGGFAPRPPTMIQRHIDNAPPVLSMGAQYGFPYQQGDYNIQYNNSGHNSAGLQPGQIFTTPNPFYNPYGESPMASPVTPVPYNQASNSHGDLAYQPHPAYISRQPSSPAPSSPAGYNGNDAHYVNLDRSSVTPFQASQYEEISRQLEVPAPSFASRPVADGGSYHNSPFVDPITPPSPARVAPEPPSLPSAGPMSPVEFNSAMKPMSPSAQTADIPAALVSKRPDTVYTLYDNDDAYGGI